MSYLIFYLGIGIIYGLYSLNELKSIFTYYETSIRKSHILAIVFMGLFWPVILITDIIDFVNYLRHKTK